MNLEQGCVKPCNGGIYQAYLVVRDWDSVSCAPHSLHDVAYHSLFPFAKNNDLLLDVRRHTYSVLSRKEHVLSQHRVGEMKRSRVWQNYIVGFRYASRGGNLGRVYSFAGCLV